jgi:hypothetical protein
METEIQKVDDLFKSNQLHQNEFTNREYDMTIFPEIWSYMNSALDYHFITAPKRENRNWDSMISDSCIDFQRHDTSIDEHTDDVSKGIFFQMITLALDECTGISAFYDKHPLFCYYGVDGRKYKTRLDFDQSIVFNPRKPHSMIYFGYKYTVALRSVIKVK